MADDWKYDIEEFDDENTGDEDSADSDGRATAVFGEATSRDIEPGSPTLENTLFVLVGIALTLLVVLGI